MEDDGKEETVAIKERTKEEIEKDTEEENEEVFDEKTEQANEKLEETEKEIELIDETKKQEKVGLIKIEKPNKDTLNKILIFIILAIVVVVSSSFAGILIAKAEHKKPEVIVEVTPEPTPELTPTPKIPVYSEEGKERLKNIYVGSDDEKIAYLTFDDGPSSSVTPQILETLRNEDIKATFFVLGSRVELYPEIVKQEYDEGHYIANHGYSHNYKSIYSSVQAVLDEYNHTEEKIKSALGNEEYSSHLFRFPGGSEGGKYKNLKNEAKAKLEENSICYINWNCLTNDSVGKPTYETIIKDFKLTQEGKNKIVVLMHDTGAKQLTADTLLEIITYLKEQGYTFKNFYDIMY